MSCLFIRLSTVVGSAISERSLNSYSTETTTGPNSKTGVPANLNQTHLNLFTIDCLIYF